MDTEVSTKREQPHTCSTLFLHTVQYVPKFTLNSFQEYSYDLIKINNNGIFPQIYFGNFYCFGRQFKKYKIFLVVDFLMAYQTFNYPVPYSAIMQLFIFTLYKPILQNIKL